MDPMLGPAGALPRCPPGEFLLGADGIFVYQADAHLCNPFTRTVLDWRRWG